MADFSEVITNHEMSVTSVKVMSLSNALDKLANFKMILRYVIIVIVATASIAKTSQTISCKDLKMSFRLL